MIFWENGESNRIGIIVTKIFRPYRFEYDHELLRFPFFAVFGTIFSIDNWWRHKYDSFRKIIKKETLGPKVSIGIERD